MDDKTCRAPFLCARDFARSVLAEGLMNALGRGRLVARSEGSRPGVALRAALAAIAER